MTNDQVKKNVVRSTPRATSASLGGWASDLVTFRLLYQGLDAEHFGFWSLLWAIFGYGILLDFGFGYAAQKKVAELSVKQGLGRAQPRAQHHLLSSTSPAPPSPCSSASLLRPAGVDLFKVQASQKPRGVPAHAPWCSWSASGSPSRWASSRRSSRASSASCTANNLNVLSTNANFICVGPVVWLKLSFLTLVVLALALRGHPLPAGGPAGVAPHARGPAPPVAVLAPRPARHREVQRLRLPEHAGQRAPEQGGPARHQLDPRRRRRHPYQAGGKVGEMFGQLTRRSPTCSRPPPRISTPGATPTRCGRCSSAAALQRPRRHPLYVRLRRLHGGHDPHPHRRGPTHPRCGGPANCSSVWYYSLVLTHWVFKRMFLMAGQERRMMWQGVARPPATWRAQHRAHPRSMAASSAWPWVPSSPPSFSAGAALGLGREGGRAEPLGSVPTGGPPAWLGACPWLPPPPPCASNPGGTAAATRCSCSSRRSASGPSASPASGVSASPPPNGKRVGMLASRFAGLRRKPVPAA
jgi:hypothetical protein